MFTVIYFLNRYLDEIRDVTVLKSKYDDALALHETQYLFGVIPKDDYDDPSYKTSLLCGIVLLDIMSQQKEVS